MIKRTPGDAQDENRVEPDEKKSWRQRFFEDEYPDIEIDDEQLEQSKKHTRRNARSTLEWIILITVIALVSIAVRTYLFEIKRVDGNSMNQTLMNGEYVFVTKIDYIVRQPARGDVVICKYPGRGEVSFVKRIIGMPGDTVTSRATESGGDIGIYINGLLLHEEYTYGGDIIFEEYILGEGQYLVMGDNRADSNDGRQIGPISEKDISGHVRSVIWPPGNFRVVPGIDAYSAAEDWAF